MKTILVTGATDGIGLETAEKLLAKGQRVLLHGRNPDKLEAVRASLSERFDADRFESFEADLSSLPAVEVLADAVAAKHESLDVLINNAGVFKTPNPVLENGQDVRFVVNTLAPALLTERLLPLLGASARVVNLSSAAQAPVDLNALAGTGRLADNAAYAQSKLALTMWTMDQGRAAGAGRADGGRRQSGVASGDQDGAGCLWYVRQGCRHRIGHSGACGAFGRICGCIRQVFRQ